MGKTLGNKGDDEFWGVSADKNGDIVAAGFLMGSNEYEKAWVVKLDDKGNVKWQKTYGGEEYGDAAFDVDTNSNYIAVGGATQNFGTEEAGTWILYLDEEGQIITELVCERGDSMLWSISIDDSSITAGGLCNFRLQRRFSPQSLAHKATGVRDMLEVHRGDKVCHG